MYLSHRQPPVQPRILPGERVAPRGRGVKDKNSHAARASASNEVATSLASSALLQPYFRGRLGLKTLLVGPEIAHELGKKLPAYGFSIGSNLLFAGPQSLLAADHG